MKQVFPTLIGNDIIKNTVGRDIVEDRLSHAYIIEGVKGSGKKTVALLAAAALSCENKNDKDKPLPCGLCLSCHKILTEISPDVIVVKKEEDKASVSVEQIREMRAGVNVLPNDGDHKVYIIEDSDKMTVQAQNALLLTLEEPPSFVTFFLLAEDSGKLLETIRSRALTIRTELLCREKCIEYLRSTEKCKSLEKINSEKFNSIISVSSGSVGIMNELLEEDSTASEMINERETALRLSSLLFDNNLTGMFEFISTMPKGNKSLIRVISYTLTAVRDILAIKKAPRSQLLFYASTEEAGKYPQKVTVKKALNLTKILEAAADKLERNASAKTVFTEIAVASYSTR